MKQTAYVINLDRRPDRWLRTQALWSPWLDLIRVPAVDMPGNGALGCKLSHCQLAESLLSNADMVLILEDDSTPLPAFKKIGLACIEEAQAHVNDWDWINGGAFTDLSKIGLPRAELSPSPSRLFVCASYAHNTHFCLYNRRTLPILKASLDSPVPVDMFLAREATEKWIPFRLLATQTDSESDIRRPFPDQHLWYDDTERMLEQFRPTE